MTATFDKRDGSAGYPSSAENPLGLIRKRVDFADDDLADLATGDTIKLIHVPKGARVLSALTKIVEPSGKEMTCTLGDNADPDGYITSILMDAAAGTETVTNGAYNTVLLAAASAATSLNLTVATTVKHTGIVDVFANILRCN